MSCKLLIIKQVRPTAEVQFYSTPEQAKNALRTYGPPAVVGERNFTNGLVRVRILLFPTINDYNDWLVNPVTSRNVKDRQTYNSKNGIIETHNVFDVSDYNILSTDV